MLTINNGWQFKQSYLDQNSTNELLTNTTFCMYTLKTYSQNKLDLAMSKVKVTTSCYISRFPGQMSRKFQVFQENYWAFYLVSLMEKINMLDRSSFFLLIHIFEKAEFYGSEKAKCQELALMETPPPLCDFASMTLGQKLLHRSTAERPWQNNYVLCLCGSLYLSEKSEGVCEEIKNCKQ